MLRKKVLRSREWLQVGNRMSDNNAKCLSDVILKLCTYFLELIKRSNVKHDSNNWYEVMHKNKFYGKALD